MSRRQQRPVERQDLPLRRTAFHGFGVRAEARLVAGKSGLPGLRQGCDGQRK
jgi:hypothetical protein